jgi:hypothetical protein
VNHDICASDLIAAEEPTLGLAEVVFKEVEVRFKLWVDEGTIDL